MRIRIETVDTLPADEIVIRCRQPTPGILRVQRMLLREDEPPLTFYKQQKSYFFPLREVLFFESGNDQVYAHTSTDIFRVKLRLYELDECLPRAFLRISKSTIVNLRAILSVDRSLAPSPALVRFRGSHKQVYASRMYQKILKQRLAERSLYED